jgi:hypothetical protein
MAAMSFAKLSSEINFFLGRPKGGISESNEVLCLFLGGE